MKRFRSCHNVAATALRALTRGLASTVNDYVSEREALSEQGAQIIGKFSRGYHRGRQRHEILDADILKPDGRRPAR